MERLSPQHGIVQVNAKANIVGDVVHSLDNSIFLQEDQLRVLSKDITKIIPKTDVSYGDKVQIYRQLFEALIRTARGLNTSVTHNAAAYNTLCSFLEHCMTSTIPELHILCFSASTWNVVFNIFLTRSENAKVKPMKHLLITLNKMLSKNRNTSVVQSINSSIIATLVNIVCGREGYAYVKPALQALDHFVTKRTISFQELSSEFDRASKGKPEFSCGTGHAAQINGSGSSDLSEESLKGNAARIFEDVLYWMNYSEIAPIAGRLLTTLSKNCPAAVANGLPLWYRPLYEVLESNPSLIDVFESHLLPDLLQSNLEHTVAFLKVLPYDEIRNGLVSPRKLVEISICLVSLRITQNLKLDRFLDTDTKFGNVESLAALFDTPFIVFSLLDHASCRIRYAALRIVLCWKTFTMPLTSEIFEVLQKAFPNFHAEVDTRTRNDFISVVGDFCARFGLSVFYSPKSPDQERSSNCLALKAQSASHEIAKHELPKFHAWFMTWYQFFLFYELRPTASYQRHITALKVLRSFVTRDSRCYHAETLHGAYYFGENKSSTLRDWTSTRLSRLLLDLVLDPFDDVRDAAASLLELVDQNIFLPTSGIHTKIQTAKVSTTDPNTPMQAWNLQSSTSIAHAGSMMRSTGRADYADGVGRLYNRLYASYGAVDDKLSRYKPRKSMIESVLKRLEDDVAIAQLDLRRAVNGAPVHGYLIALRYIVGRRDFYYHNDGPIDQNLFPWRKFHSQIFQICVEIWKIVRRVLCNDSPEGHLPETNDDATIDIGTKDVLSFSWRALKESSLLIHAMIISNSDSMVSSDLIVRFEDYKALGSLAFQQLAELRHRGAFSTVAQTFAACCMKCTQLQAASLEHLPRIWYQDALACVQDKSSTLTRRSAGLPAMITGILIAIPSGSFFDNAMLDLQAIADTPVVYDSESDVLHLPQVHALNCLKDLFTTTRLGSSTEPYVENSLSIAAESLVSNVWAIRNCALMLLKALLNRLSGGSDVLQEIRSGTIRRSSPMIYEKYQNLPDLLTTMLRLEAVGSSVSRAQQVFPALEMIERWGLPNHQKVIISQLVWSHMESSNWSIREKAARAMCTVMGNKALNNKIGDLFDPQWPSQNALHGRLLCARFLLAQRKRANSCTNLDDLGPFLTLFAAPYDTLFLHNACPYTNDALFQLTTMLLDTLRSIDVPEGQRYALAQRPRLWFKWCSNHQAFSSARTDNENRNYNPESATLARCLIVVESLCAGIPKELMDIFSTLVGQLCKFDVKEALRIMAHLRNVPYGHDFEYFNSLLPILMSILRETINSHVGAAVTNSVADFTAALGATKGWDLMAGEEPFPSLLDLLYARLSSLRSSPLDFDADLRFCGNILGVAYPSAPDDPHIHKILVCWIEQLRLAGDERSELSTRLAAIQSIYDFRSALRRCDSKPPTAPQLLGMYLVLYDTLHDDDEDVRDHGAVIVSWLLSDPAASSDLSDAATLSLMPLAASSMLVAFLITKYHTSKNLWKEAVRRVVGVASVAYLRSARELLEKATKEDIALFVEEKQNLFVDPVTEAEAWTEVLINMNSEAIDMDLVSNLGAWVIEGLHCLLEYTKRETDGPLGWASKPDVFIVGSRIILATKVQLHLIGTGASEAHAAPIEDIMTTLLEAGNKNELHGIWLQRIEEILESTHVNNHYFNNTTTPLQTSPTKHHATTTMHGAKTIAFLLSMSLVFIVVMWWILWKYMAIFHNAKMAAQAAKRKRAAEKAAKRAEEAKKAAEAVEAVEAAAATAAPAV